MTRTSSSAGQPNESAVAQYRAFLDGHPALIAAARVELAGRDLACWCPPALACHADVLLAVASARHDARLNQSAAVAQARPSSHWVDVARLHVPPDPPIAK